MLFEKKNKNKKIKIKIKKKKEANERKRNDYISHLYIPHNSDP